MSRYVYRVVSDGPMPDSWRWPNEPPDGWYDLCEVRGWVGTDPETGAPEYREIGTLAHPRERFLSRDPAKRLAGLRTRFGWPSRVERGEISWETDDAW